MTRGKNVVPRQDVNANRIQHSKKSNRPDSDEARPAKKKSKLDDAERIQHLLAKLARAQGKTVSKKKKKARRDEEELSESEQEGETRKKKKSKKNKDKSKESIRKRKRDASSSDEDEDDEQDDEEERAALYVGEDEAKSELDSEDDEAIVLEEEELVPVAGYLPEAKSSRGRKPRLMKKIKKKVELSGDFKRRLVKSVKADRKFVCQLAGMRTLDKNPMRVSSLRSMVRTGLPTSYNADKKRTKFTSVSGKALQIFRDAIVRDVCNNIMVPALERQLDEKDHASPEAREAARMRASIKERHTLSACLADQVTSESGANLAQPMEEYMDEIHEEREAKLAQHAEARKKSDHMALLTKQVEVGDAAEKEHKLSPDERARLIAQKLELYKLRLDKNKAIVARKTKSIASVIEEIASYKAKIPLAENDLALFKRVNVVNAVKELDEVVHRLEGENDKNQLKQLRKDVAACEAKLATRKRQLLVKTRRPAAHAHCIEQLEVRKSKAAIAMEAAKVEVAKNKKLLSVGQRLQQSEA